MAWVITLCQALIAIPKIGAYIEQVIQAVTVWYVSSQNKEIRLKIVDAAAFSLHAEGKDGRLEAAKKWQQALSSSPISS